MLDKLFDISAETKKTLRASGKKFAQELGVEIFETQIRIMYAKDNSPYYLLYKAVDNGMGGKKWEKVRAVKLDEII